MAGMTDTFSPTHLLLIRHGETDANRNGVWQGATDSHLNARGQAQARAVAARLAAERAAVSAIYSSPLSRAAETAAIIAARLGLATVTPDPRLAEFDLGEWEGLDYEVLRHEKRLWARMAADPSFAPPGGESARNFALRLLAGVREIAAAHAGQRMILVSHGGALATALAMILHAEGNRWPEYQMGNCALSELAFTPQPQLLRFNEVAHLQAIGVLDKW